MLNHALPFKEYDFYDLKVEKSKSRSIRKETKNN